MIAHHAPQLAAARLERAIGTAPADGKTVVLSRASVTHIDLMVSSEPPFQRSLDDGANSKCAASLRPSSLAECRRGRISKRETDGQMIGVPVKLQYRLLCASAMGFSQRIIRPDYFGRCFMKRNGQSPTCLGIDPKALRFTLLREVKTVIP